MVSLEVHLFNGQSAVILDPMVTEAICYIFYVHFHKDNAKHDQRYPIYE